MQLIIKREDLIDHMKEMDPSEIRLFDLKWYCRDAFFCSKKVIFEDDDGNTVLLKCVE